MKVTGIIAEYNPFHNGHAYQIRELKKKTGADYIVIALGGNFMQRGEPAILNKYARTEMALRSGADLVIELPVIWATASAEYFAKAGVTVMRNLGVVDFLGFGAESESLIPLQNIAALLREEPVQYRQLLQKHLKSGLSFPSARAQAAAESLSGCTDRDTAIELMGSPNNILAIEYLKSLKDTDPIKPVLIPRVGAGYHEKQLCSGYDSATAIRQALMEGTPVSSVPSSSRNVLERYAAGRRLLHTDCFSQMLGYRLLMLRHEGYDAFADCSPDLSNRIKNHLYEFRSFTQFANLLKSKELTQTRVYRALLHILLDIRSGDYTAAQSCGYIPYLRVLGFCRKAAPLLSAIKQNASLPLTTKVADAVSSLSPEALALFRKDLFASDLYEQSAAKENGPITNEFTHGVVLI